jgi:hypothetical protein
MIPTPLVDESVPTAKHTEVDGQSTLARSMTFGGAFPVDQFDPASVVKTTVGELAYATATQVVGDAQEILEKSAPWWTNCH